MPALTITLIQTRLHWEDKTANLAMLEEKIWGIGRATDVIVLPEMFSTSFSMNSAALAERMNEQTFRWMGQMARQTGALVLGSFIARENDKFYNRLLWMQPNADFRTYDKRHLFRMADEDKAYAPGAQKFVGEWKGWKICPLVCYDLRFPLWSRNKYDNESGSHAYDVLIYVANWPQSRVAHWDTLLRARAIENLSYVVGVNRVGTDGKGIAYNGHSAVIGPRGETLLSAGDNESIQTISLDEHTLKEYRAAFPAHLDADNFTIL